MNYYLVDYENVNINGLKNLPNLKRGDMVKVFFSESCNNIAVDVLFELEEKGVDVKYVKASVGSKNALDFQLTSVLGYLIGKNGNRDSYYIISNDKGFDAVCEFWKKESIIIKRIPIDNQNIVSIKNNEKITIDEIETIIPNVKEKVEVLNIVNDNSNKNAIYRDLAKLYRDNNKSQVIYSALKPLLKMKGKA